MKQNRKTLAATTAILALAMIACANLAKPQRAEAGSFFLSTHGFSIGIASRPAPPPGPVVYEVAPPRVVPVPPLPPPPPPAVIRVVPPRPLPPPVYRPPFDPYDRGPAFAPHPVGPRPHYGGLTPMPGGPGGPGGPRPGGIGGPGGPRPGGPGGPRR